MQNSLSSYRTECASVFALVVLNLLAAAACGVLGVPARADGIKEPADSLEVTPPARTVPLEAPQPLPSPAIENFYRLDEGLYSGGEPRGKAAFAQLAALGVKTLVSVDGAPPDVETARRHGLRYVHLPLGYQGFSEEACLRLARAITSLPGPVFVHCHHGKHRGPTAAAVMAIARRGWTPEQAERWLQTAGTSTNYAGLYATVRRWRPPAPEALARVPVEFPEVARPPDLVRAMVDVDRAWEHLQAIAAAGYRSPPDQPDLVPAREAARLAARLAESRQFPEVTRAADDLQERFHHAEREARELARLLGQDPLPAADILARQFQVVGRSCTACHRAFRDRAER